MKAKSIAEKVLNIHHNESGPHAAVQFISSGCLTVATCGHSCSLWVGWWAGVGGNWPRRRGNKLHWCMRARLLRMDVLAFQPDLCSSYQIQRELRSLFGLEQTLAARDACFRVEVLPQVWAHQDWECDGAKDQGSLLLKPETTLGPENMNIFLLVFLLFVVTQGWKSR